MVNRVRGEHRSKNSPARAGLSVRLFARHAGTAAPEAILLLAVTVLFGALMPMNNLLILASVTSGPLRSRHVQVCRCRLRKVTGGPFFGDWTQGQPLKTFR
ncbi:hypothetical protein ASF69_19915 [Rhizobium sp. Leaf311]|nr:hypothetical protein ASF69_19915 [Rhizobium sp. Leaf311]